MTLYRYNRLVGGCITTEAGELLNKMYGSANKTGDASKATSYFLRNKSELQDGTNDISRYNQTGSQADTASMADSAAQDMTPTQGMQNVNRMDSAANGKEYSMIRDENDAAYLGQKEDYDNRTNAFGLNQSAWNGNNHGEQNEGDHDNSVLSWKTVIRDMQTGTVGDSRNLNGGYRGQDISQFGLGQTLGLGALQGMADSGMQNGDMRQASDEDVIQNSTGWNFALDIAERESIGKMPLPTYLGYDVKDNIKMIEFVSEKYKNEIDTVWEIAQGTAPTIAIELAKKGARFLPPHLQAGALGALALLDICLALNDVYEKWDADVTMYAQEHKCSREVAEKNVSPLKNILDATMIFSTQEWVARALEAEEIHARSKVAIIAAALSSIPEQSLREWGRSFRE